MFLHQVEYNPMAAIYGTIISMLHLSLQYVTATESTLECLKRSDYWWLILIWDLATGLNDIATRGSMPYWSQTSAAAIAIKSPLHFTRHCTYFLWSIIITNFMILNCLVPYTRHMSRPGYIYGYIYIFICIYVYICIYNHVYSEHSYFCKRTSG